MEAVGQRATFAVHWLNNKELVFRYYFPQFVPVLLLMLTFLTAWARRSFCQRHSKARLTENRTRLRGKPTSPRPQSTSPVCSCPGLHPLNKGDLLIGSVASDPTSCQQLASHSDLQSVLSPGSTLPESQDSGDSYHKDLLDVRLEELLREWAQSSDVLFTIHPIDASLLVWTLEWLDDVSRGAVVSFSSRLPSAFPLSDASSLRHSNLLTFNPHWPRFVHLLHPDSPACPSPALSAASSPSVSPNRFSGQLPAANMSKIFLLSNHENGSLNLWHVDVDDKSRFTTILNLSHRSRMCGHRLTELLSQLWSILH